VPLARHGTCQSNAVRNYVGGVSFAAKSLCPPGYFGSSRNVFRRCQVFISQRVFRSYFALSPNGVAPVAAELVEPRLAVFPSPCPWSLRSGSRQGRGSCHGRY